MKVFAHSERFSIFQLYVDFNALRDVVVLAIYICSFPSSVVFVRRLF